MSTTYQSGSGVVATGSPDTPAAAARESAARNVSVGDLTSRVTDDLSTLFRQEIALAKSELRAEAVKGGKGAGMFAGAGGAGYFAALFALLAAMFGLGEVMALGWAALAVTVVLAVAAAVLALSGRKTLRRMHPAPTQTIETVKEDVRWAANRRR
jgi:VIT1/CCC1 family predicted Fe2+/Mn2+ transporter